MSKAENSENLLSQSLDLPEHSGLHPELKNQNEGIEAVVLTAAQDFGSIQELSQAIMKDPEATNIQRSRAQELAVSGAHYFSKFYKGAKKVLPKISLLLALYNIAEQPRVITYDDRAAVEKVAEKKQKKDQGYLAREDMDWKGQIIDSFLGGDFLRIYNKFAYFKNNRINGQMSDEEIGFKEDIAQNMDPWNYRDIVGISGKYLDLKQEKRQFSKENLAKGRPKDRVREDLFRKYLGLRQNYNSLNPSQYKPTKAKNPDSEYWSFDGKKMVESIKIRLAHEKQKHNKTDTRSHRDPVAFADLEQWLTHFKHPNQRALPNTEYTGEQMGRYITSSGYDDGRQEKYISYYDIWDLDPPVLKSMGIDINRFNFPFEIYGRIYESDFN